uniref:Uncharacterized protein n=1 Tax=mine drainage metagenome TaxID=410659 RepID=E6QWW9_9ZZZZ
MAARGSGGEKNTAVVRGTTAVFLAADVLSATFLAGTAVAPVFAGSGTVDVALIASATGKVLPPLSPTGSRSARGEASCGASDFFPALFSDVLTLPWALADAAVRCPAITWAKPGTGLVPLAVCAEAGAPADAGVAIGLAVALMISAAIPAPPQKDICTIISKKHA